LLTTLLFGASGVVCGAVVVSMGIYELDGFSLVKRTHKHSDIVRFQEVSFPAVANISSHQQRRVPPLNLRKYLRR